MSEIKNVGGPSWNVYINTGNTPAGTPQPNSVNYDNLFDIQDPTYSSFANTLTTTDTSSGFDWSMLTDPKKLADWFSKLLQQWTEYFQSLLGDNSDGSQTPSSTYTPPAVNTGNNFLATPTPTPSPTGSSDSPIDTGGTNGFSTQPQHGQLSSAQTKQTAQQLTSQLMKDFGLTKEQAAGVVGNLMHESAGLNANINQYGFANGGGPGAPSGDMNQGYGWVQWSYDRKRAYLDYSRQHGMDPASPAANYAFLKHELQTSESGTIAAIKKTHSASDAAVAFRKVYERAENPVDGSRISAANQVYGWIA